MEYVIHFAKAVKLFQQKKQMLFQVWESWPPHVVLTERH